MSLPVLDTLGCQVVDCRNFAGDRPYAAIVPWDVRAVYFNALDPVVTAAVILEAERDHGLYGCVYDVMPRGSASFSDGVSYAGRLSQHVEDLGGMTRVNAVLVDVEKVPLTFQQGFCRRWDELRPFRPTIFSVEPFQDASQNDYQSMLARNQAAPGVRKVTFQCYFGGMQPQLPRAVRDYLTQRGLSPDDLCPTIDPRQPAAIVGSALACGTRGAVLFQAGRML